MKTKAKPKTTAKADAATSKSVPTEGPRSGETSTTTGADRAVKLDSGAAVNTSSPVEFGLYCREAIPLELVDSTAILEPLR